MRILVDDRLVCDKAHLPAHPLRRGSLSELSLNVVGKFVVLQFRLARGGSRNAVEYIPPIPEHQAKEGMVP